VNFAKGGENKTLMNSWYLFYNASLQGSMALINAAAKSSKVRKVWAGLVVYGIMQDQINSLLSGDEDEDGIKDYDELPRYVLEHNLILPTFGLSK
jgi:surface polysaccharide O-acyltransferase-like enzyme